MSDLIAEPKENAMNDVTTQAAEAAKSRTQRLEERCERLEQRLSALEARDGEQRARDEMSDYRWATTWEPKES